MDLYSQPGSLPAQRPEGLDASGLAPDLLALASILLLVAAIWILWQQRRQNALVAVKVRARARALNAARQEIAAREARSRAFFDLGTVGLAELDADLSIRRCNEELATMLGTVPGKLQGTCVLDAIEPREHDDLRDGATALLTAVRDRHACLLRMRRADGAALRVAVSLRATRAPDGRFDQFVAVLEDMTEILQLVETLQEAKHQADAATKAKSDFLANMSHEIRTPITAILGYMDLMRDEEQSPAGVQAMDVIQRNGKHLLVILDDILDLSKIEAGKFAIVRTSFALTPVLDDVLTLMRARAIEKGLALTLEADGRVPLLLDSDPTRLRQILINLVGNAVKFTAQGGVTVAVVETDDGGRPGLELRVRDTGIGITEAQQRALFQPFEQADSSMARRFGGTGLGLAISARLAGMLGGTLRVASVPGEGTTFTLALDAEALGGGEWAPSLAEARERSRVAAEAATAPGITAPCRVLIAEDGPDNQRLLRALLTRAGHELELVDDGQQAVEAVERAARDGAPFDVVLMDMQMPVLDGYAATRTLRERGITVPVIACTAHALLEERDKCLQAGCDDYTTKPIDRRDLLRKVARWSQERRPAAAAERATPALPFA